MTDRTCTKCRQDRPLFDFRKNAKGRDGLHSHCRACANQDAKSRRLADGEAARVKDRESRERRADARRQYAKAYYAKNADKQKQLVKEWRLANMDRHKEYISVYRQKNRAAITARAREYRKENPETIRVIQRKQTAKRLSTPRGKMEHMLRSTVTRWLKPGAKAGRKTFDLLDFTPTELVAHLERLFLPGMSWANYGEWHVDHVIPLSAHNYETPDDLDFKKAWALSNLQPLWTKDNASKGAKIKGGFQPSLSGI